MRSAKKTIPIISLFFGLLSLNLPLQLFCQESEIPKAPEDDLMVKAYKALDAKKAERLTFTEKYKVDKSDVDVDVVVSYYNWAINAEDFWNRQLSIEFKTKDGYVVEKIVKSGFGELGFIKKGDSKTQDSYKKEKVVSSGSTSKAVMVDLSIGGPEQQRFRSLLDKYVFK